jgi:AraC family transcriptional activator of pobA
MVKSESISEFYKRIGSPGNGRVIYDKNDQRQQLGHFNVYRRSDFYCKTYSPYNRRDFYKISLIIGEGTLHYADKGIIIDKPALLFSNPTIPYAWEASSPKQEGFFCLFNQDFVNVSLRNDSVMESPLFKIGGDPVFFVTPQQQEFLCDIFAKMQVELESEYIHKYDLLRNYVNLIIHEALKSKPADSYFQHTNASSRIVSLFIELLERQFPIDSPDHVLRLKTAGDYAMHLSVHANHLNRVVKEITGKTTTELIAERIIKEAKALLLHTSWNVSEIAYSLGFEYPAYFNNFFKKQTKQTPRSFRA